MEELRNLMKTRFIISCKSVQLGEVLDKLPVGTEVDLKGCRFGPSSENILRKYYKKLNFCNSEDKELDAYLKHNCRVSKDTSIQPTTVLDATKLDMANLPEYLLNFDKTKTYRVGSRIVTANPDYQELTKSMALAVIITMKYPEVAIDLGNYARDTFEMVRKNWIFVNPHSKYVEVIGNAVVYRDVVDGMVHVPGYGNIPEAIYVSEYICLPAEFGSVNVCHDTEFREAFTAAVNTVVHTKVRPVSMKDYIEVRCN